MRYLLIFLFSLHLGAYDAFIKPYELKNSLNSNNLVLLDVSPLSSYDQSHIPGALHVDIARFIKSKHPKLSVSFSQKVETEMSRLGINKDSHVVIYSRTNDDDCYNVFYLAFLFIQHGFENVSLLDGGYMSWVFKYHEDISTQESKPSKKGNFQTVYNPELLVGGDYLNEGEQMIPAKALEELFFEDLTLKSSAELKRVFSNELDLDKNIKVAVYGDTLFAVYANWYLLYKIFDLKNMKIYKKEAK